MGLQVWGGSYDLEIITDASDIVCGVELLARRKNSRCPNRDIWSLIYPEVDKKEGAGLLAITKIKSHIDGVQAYCREAPLWQIPVNELADFAAEINSDRIGPCNGDKMKVRSAEACLLRVCKRIAALGSSLREHVTDIPLVVADIATSCEAQGERRRDELSAATVQKVKMMASRF